MKQRDRTCECLDFVEAAHRARVYPLMYVRMRLTGYLDLEHLKKAVFLSSKIVPEILFAYDFQKGRFVHLGFTAEDIVVTDTENRKKFMCPNLSRQAQLHIIVRPKPEYTQVVFVMSHILADGKGFLEYLYLLAAIYNDEPLDMGMKNERDIAFLLKNVHVLSPTEQTMNHRRLPSFPIGSSKKRNILETMYSSGKEMTPICLKTKISPEDMEAIYQKAKRSGVTFNDLFMTAYARVIARIQNVDKIVLPCPADLRRFSSESEKLTVANMTGIYRSIVIEIPNEETFDETLRQVHIEMALQKSRKLCFSGIKPLYRIFHRAPVSLIAYVIKAVYRLNHISYTNIGMIDGQRLSFKNCTVRDCYITGSYRRPPDFQLTVSTFGNVCTLNCVFMGSAGDAKKGRSVLEQVKQEILDWKMK